MERGANIDIQDDYENTALVLASERGHFDVAKTLLERGANMDIRNNYGNTALILASIYRSLDIVKILLESGANYNVDSGKDFFNYIDEEDKDEIQQIIDRVSGIYIKG